MWCKSHLVDRISLSVFQQFWLLWQLRSEPVVVSSIGFEDPAHMVFAQDHHMVQTLPPYRARSASPDVYSAKVTATQSGDPGRLGQLVARPILGGLHYQYCRAEITSPARMPFAVAAGGVGSESGAGRVSG